MEEFARLAGASPFPVLLSGETGCGKTHLARTIHELGDRSRRAFVRINCGAIPETLFEREMFGHVRGAFTDAREQGTGFLEAADGGTLFLDEIGELPLHVQPKLLAVLEDGTFRRLGSPREVRVDTRVIAATNRDLGAMVAARTFRQDLFYRFSVLQYRIQPLRERPGEFPAIVSRILERNAAPGKDPPALTPGALAAMQRYPWPGNVRELENALRAALVFSDGQPIEMHHLPREVWAHVSAAGSPAHAATERYAAPADRTEEEEAIRRALELAHGNKAAAARALGMSRSTLWAKLQRSSHPSK
jgi:DNA-binding NtrC family response regulator